MQKDHTSLADMPIGVECFIDSFTDSDIMPKLIEMGCIPGEKVTVKKYAPLGDPIAISVAGYTLSLRKAEAKSILVSMLS